MKKTTIAESLCNFVLQDLEAENIKTLTELYDINIVRSVVEVCHNYNNTLLVMSMEEVVRNESGESKFKLTENDLMLAYKKAIGIMKERILNNTKKVV